MADWLFGTNADDWDFVVRAVASDGSELGRGVLIAPQLALLLVFGELSMDIPASLTVESFVSRRRSVGAPLVGAEELVFLILEEPLERGSFPGFSDVQDEEACVTIDAQWSGSDPTTLRGTVSRDADHSGLDVTLDTRSAEFEGWRGAPIMVSGGIAGLLDAKRENGRTYRALSFEAFDAMTEMAATLDQLASKGEMDALSSTLASLAPAAQLLVFPPAPLADEGSAAIPEEATTKTSSPHPVVDDDVLMTVTARHAIEVADRWALNPSPSGPSPAMLIVLAALASPSRGGVVRQLRLQLAQLAGSRSDGGAVVNFALNTAGLSAEIAPLPADQSLVVSVNLHEPPGERFAQVIERAHAGASLFGLDELHRRHLLAAAVMSLELTDDGVLSALRVTQPELVRLLFETLRRVEPDEPAAQWAQLLEVVRTPDEQPVAEAPEQTEPALPEAPEAPEQPAPESPEQPVPETPARPDVAYGVSVSSDFVVWDGDNPLVDHLGVDTYVAMLCNVVAAVSTPLPISIGLFGEWGTGKSYFMGLMQQEIQRLARRSRSERRDVHCKHVVQVRFNAWHYAEANLWASLAAEIFLQLATAGDPDDAEEERLAEERRKLLSELASVQEIKIDLEAERRALEGTLAKRQEQLTKAEADLELAEAEPYRVKAVIQAALESSELADEYANTSAAVKDLGLRLGHTYDEFEAVESDMRESTRGSNKWRLLSGRAGALALGLVVLIAVVLALVPRLSGIGKVLTGLPAMVLSVLAVVRLWANKISKVADRVGAVMQRSRELTTGESASVRRQVAASVEDAQRYVATLKHEEDQAAVRIAEIGTALAGMESGERLRDFIAKRNASDDYKKTLGLVSYVRRDFDELTRLLNHRLDDQLEKSNSATPSAGNDQPEIDTVDRIVLYIDDLDRCSAQRVVKVLEAVHLLLALDLFVVVVGVDPRWLAQSLRAEYRGILELGDATEGDERFWQATPQNYLEKIFQIPFVLPAMDATSAETYVESLVMPPTSRRSRRSPQEAAALPNEPSTPDVANSGAAVEPNEPTDRTEEGSEAASQTPAGPSDPITVEPASPVANLLQNITPEAERFELEPREEAFMKLLAPMVETPRAIKRMFNIYRMLRGTKTEQTFVDTGEYQVLALLLAILTGYPNRFADLYSGANPTQRAQRLYLRDTEVTTWSAFVDGLQPRERRMPGFDPPAVPEHWQNDVSYFDGDAAFTEWADLHRQLKAIEPALLGDDIRPYKTWAPTVCRFSFELSPVTIR
jgi:hypothetical protein